MSRRDKRSTAEWAVFAVSGVVLLVLVGLVVAQLGESDLPATPVVRHVDDAREENGRYFVAAEIENRGDETAVNVQVTGELTIAGETTTGDQVVDFLAADEITEVVFVFADDPADGELTIEVSSFGAP